MRLPYSTVRADALALVLRTNDKGIRLATSVCLVTGACLVNGSAAAPPLSIIRLLAGASLVKDMYLTAGARALGAGLWQVWVAGYLLFLYSDFCIKL